MSVLRCNGARVLEARVRLNRWGAWAGTVQLDAPLPAAPAEASLVDDAGIELARAMVYRYGVYQDTARLHLVGGGEWLYRRAPARYYRAAQPWLVASDLAAELGGRLSSRVPRPENPAAAFASWVRAEGRGLGVLADLVGVLDAREDAEHAWRALADGSLWFGPETWPDAADDGAATVLEEPERDAVTLAPDAWASALEPGTLWRGRRVSQVTHRWTEQSYRVSLAFEQEGALDDRAVSDGGVGGATVRQLTRAAFWGVHYPATVTAQRADGTLDVQPELARLPLLTEVPLRAGLPGVTVEVSAGARVLVGFEGGRPDLPVAVLWGSGAGAEASKLVRLTVGDAGAAARVGREGDAVNCDPIFKSWLEGVAAAASYPNPVPSSFGVIGDGASKLRTE